MVGGAVVGGVTGFVVCGGLVGGGAFGGGAVVAGGADKVVGAGAAGEPALPAGRVVPLAAGVVVVLEELGVGVAVVVEVAVADPRSLESDPQLVASAIATSTVKARMIGDGAPRPRRPSPPARDFTSYFPAT